MFIDSKEAMENSIYLKSVPLVFENHGSKLLKALHEQQKKSQLCDLSLVVENVSFPAHKCVLASYSDYFYALFDQGKQTDDAGSKACNVTTIHLSSITLNTFIPILHYLYTSKLHVFTENVKDVMRTAKKLQITTIVKACEKLLDDNTVLPSVHEVCNKQSSDTILTQSNTSESVLYVDLRSEDDDGFPVTQTATSFSKTVDNNMDQIVQTSNAFALDQPSGTKQKSSRTQKKKGFPKKLQPLAPTSGVLTSEQDLSPVRSISTVAPASIFGRVISNQSSKAKNFPSPMLPLISSSDNVSKVASNPLSIEPLSFENNLDALGTIFAADSGLIMDAMQSENLNCASTSVDKTAASSSRLTSSADPLQLQSVFSMSPKFSPHKATVSSSEWSRLQDALTASVSSVLPTALPTAGLITSPASILQSPNNCTPSVYSCKECRKYFATLPEAIHHFYTAHPSTSNMSKTTHTTSIKSIKSNSHVCPHCGRAFNNKNNLKRHILIKHTSDKRFKCSMCGRRYAIRQSLQYHMKSVHGRNVEEAKAACRTSPSTSSTASYPFEPVSSAKDIANSLTDTFCFSVGTTNTSNSLLEAYNQLSAANPPVSSPGTYLTTVSLVNDDNSNSIDRSAEKSESMPTIQRVESIRSIPTTTMEDHGTSHIGLNNDKKAKFRIKPTKKILNNNRKTGARYTLSGGSDLPPLLPVYSLPSTKSSDPSNEITPRLHRCEHCSRIFSTLHAYTRHKRTCNTHECPICHRGFSQIGNMRRHMKIFHCEHKPYQCHMCHKAYGLKQSFRYHMRDKHGSVDPPKASSRTFSVSYPVSSSQEILPSLPDVSSFTEANDS